MSSPLTVPDNVNVQKTFASEPKQTSSALEIEILLILADLSVATPAKKFPIKVKHEPTQAKYEPKQAKYEPAQGKHEPKHVKVEAIALPREFVNGRNQTHTLDSFLSSFKAFTKMLLETIGIGQGKCKTIKLSNQKKKILGQSLRVGGSFIRGMWDYCSGLQCFKRNGRDRCCREHNLLLKPIIAKQAKGYASFLWNHPEKRSKFPAKTVINLC